MFVRNVEKFLEDHIEGFFNKKFSSYLQEVEIYKRLEKEIYFKKKTDQNQTYVPNDYLIFLSEADYDNLYSEELCENIAAQIIGYANKQGWNISGSLLVKCQADNKLKKGCFCIETEYVHETAASEEKPAEIAEAKEADDVSGTIIFQRSDKMTSSDELSRKLKFARLTVTEGRDLDKSLELGLSRVNIGRRVSNEFVLSDRNTSRLHAYIVCRNYQHILIDAESLNGTYVNGHRLTEEYVLKSGDVIKAGNTVLLYEVNDGE